MKKLDMYPPPNWTEVIILWDDIFNNHLPIRKLLDWVDITPGGLYCLTGVDNGFLFNFKNPADATFFKLKWI